MKSFYATLCVVAVGLTGCSGSASAQGGDTFSAKGSITVSGSVTAAQSSSDPECHGVQGYDDMQEGAQVKVSADGKTVGLGRLDRGVSQDQNYSCKFTFTVDGVPAGSKFYSVEVSHRGTMEYTEDDLKNGVSLSLGS